MENSTEELREGVDAEVSKEEAELTEDKTHNKLKGATNSLMEEEEEEEEANGGEKLQNGDRGGGDGGEGGEGVMAAEGGGDLSSINAMMSAVMSAAGTINGGRTGDGESGVTSANSSAGPSPSPSPSKALTSAMRAPPSRNARRNQDTKDDSSAHICPLCDKSCQTQHQLTMHIRQHNADTGATDHSCSICGKCLSSASSLDRHMLVHSGERPYKCTICGQTFTTNGNMHRHMKIHEKDPASGLLPVSPPSPTKRRRPSVKRRQSPDDENVEEPPFKKMVEDAGSEEPSAVLRGAEEELLPCPICFKTCSSRLELDAHMDTHPDTALRCDLCCLSFRTHRGLLRHNAGVHKLLPQDPSGRPFIQSNPSIPTGFNDLAFIDFSCKKFAHIAQIWCETNLRRCISKFHRFICDSCDKAFPLRSALDLHKSTSHPDKPATNTEEMVEAVKEDRPAENGAATDGLSQDTEKDALPLEQASFLQGLGLQHISQVKSGPTDDEIHQAHLDSIKVIHVEPPCSSLPQEPASGYLSGGLGLTLELGVGSLAAFSIPLLEASASGLSQRDALSLLSLQPFQAGLLLQPDGGAATASAASSGAKPGEACGAGIMELADIQQILRVAAAAPNQIGLTLPNLTKVSGFPGGQGQVQAQKAMPPLKPKPPITPRSSLTATTPPPLQSSQQASLGCISPSLPPPTPTLFKTPSSSSSSSSSVGNGGQMDAECMGDAHTPLSDSPPAATTAVHEEAGISGRKTGTKGGNNANAGSAKGSFPCRFCDQVFAFSGLLQAHMRFHLGILPHQCNICDYIAPDKATLIRHLRTHSGERPYVCRVCHYPFTVKANCERHLRKKHNKTSRKDIEKNIKYVTSTTTANIPAITTTQDTEPGCPGAETTCRYCGEDLKTYRALQIHLRTHNGCQRKPFECKRCGAAFLAKRNCIHHLLKHHPEVQEREIEDHITTLLPNAGPVATAASVQTAVASQMVLNGLSQSPIQTLQAVKVEEMANTIYPPELDQPLDFSAKGRGGHSQAGSPGVKVESISPSFDCSVLDQPIDLSIPSKRQRRESVSGEKREIKTEQSSSIELQHLALSKDEKTAQPALHPQLGCYQLPPGSTPPPAPLPNLNSAARGQRLKPLLPKPMSSSSSSASTALKELPPLASIAQIIHSVSGAPDLLKREAASLEGKPQIGVSSADCAADAPGPSSAVETQSDDTSEGPSRRRSRKKPAALAVKEKTAVSRGIDLESSGEFASVEKMLATTDTNKFSNYLQPGAADLGAKRDVDREEKEGGARDEVKPVAATPQSKGKKNAYSNSVQKMTCPFCPRVFPWASSLQRHMLTHTGQKPFPCPRCDAFFSTKSNCERHLLRKHGVTHRTLRRNGALVKKEGEEGSAESAESQSETEQATPEAQDLSSATSADTGPAPVAESPTPSEKELESVHPSPTHRPSQGCSPATEQQETETSEEPEPPRSPDTRAAQGKQSPPSNSSKVESTDDDDCHSNKSLDLNFGKKLIDFKLSASSGSTQEEQTSSSPSSSSTSAPQVATESLEEKGTTPASSPAVKQQPEYKHVCRVCNKSFRYATTLARHERAHLSEETQIPAAAEESPPVKEDVTESNTNKPDEEEQEQEKEMEAEEEEGGVKGGESEAGESGESEEEKEKDERSDEEASEPKTSEEGEAAGGRVDKRKKICNVCSKRFWSLQDLTRHMRSHTGERPYQCQTCERTFTLKHSLVRHQRIHLKPRGAGGSSNANDDVSEDGDSCTPTPTSTCPPSENESECGSGVAGTKELEEEDLKEDVETADVAESAALEEEDASKRVDVGEESESRPSVISDNPDAEEQPKLMQHTSADAIPSQQATETTNDESPKEPSSSSCAQGEQAAARTQGFIQELLEIQAKAPVEHILPSGEAPLVGAE